ncbi:MAG: tyrosine--tRNA ligase [Bacteroidales bacterium]|nr:tyrosine--tRNA ligase [Bacteroidales bacterium]
MPNKNFVEELKWRGLLHDITPNAEEILSKENSVGYIGIDPTADSLHIGHLVGVMVMKHFQNAGHKPIIVVGGATGMIGDPSGKSEERNLLDEKALRYNEEALKKQISHFINFSDEAENQAILVNNYDWTKDYSFLDFNRDFGKHLTISYMLSKDSVKQRIASKSGISFTEFTYQLLQGYDFYHLYHKYNCKFQLGGSDQWGNITTGIELIRRKSANEAYGITVPLITKADGKKFGKTEKGNIWLSPEKTTPYEFYQFFMNTADEDAEKFIRIFSFKSREVLETIIAEHNAEPHKRIVQKALADELTATVHGQTELQNAIDASNILFGKGTKESLSKLNAKTFEQIFDGVASFEIAKDLLTEGINIIELLAEKTAVFASKGECRRLMKDNGLSINQEKQNDANYTFTQADLINDKYILIRKGKKNYSYIIVK